MACSIPRGGLLACVLVASLWGGCSSEPDGDDGGGGSTTAPSTGGGGPVGSGGAGATGGSDAGGSTSSSSVGSSSSSSAAQSSSSQSSSSGGGDPCATDPTDSVCWACCKASSCSSIAGCNSATCPCWLDCMEDKQEGVYSPSCVNNCGQLPIELTQCWNIDCPDDCEFSDF